MGASVVAFFVFDLKQQGGARQKVGGDVDPVAAEVSFRARQEKAAAGVGDFYCRFICRRKSRIAAMRAAPA